MKRALRILFDAAAVPSLVLCIASACLYFRAGRLDSFHVRTGDGTYYFLDAGPGRIELNRSRGSRGMARWGVAGVPAV
jgi:hypothetical protein